MPTLAEAREGLASAVSEAGVPCSPYPVENPSPPLAWVQAIELAFLSGFGPGSYCLPGTATASIVAIDQRNDLPSGVAALEAWLQPALDALADVPGLLIQTAGTGSLNVSGQDLPAATITVQFPI